MKIVDFFSVTYYRLKPVAWTVGCKPTKDKTPLGFAVSPLLGGIYNGTGVFKSPLIGEMSRSDRGVRHHDAY